MSGSGWKDVAKLHFARIAVENAGQALFANVEAASKNPVVICMLLGGTGAASTYALVSGGSMVALFTLSTPVLMAAIPGAIVGIWVGSWIKDWRKRRQIAKKAIDQLLIACEKSQPIQTGLAKEIYPRMCYLLAEGKEVRWATLDDVRFQCNMIEASACFDLFLLLWVESPNGMWTVNAICAKCGRRLELANLCVCPIVFQENNKHKWTAHCRGGRCCCVKEEVVVKMAPARCDDSKTTPSADSEKSVDATEHDFELKK